MARLLFQARSLLTYWLDAVDEHSLHSPFFYDFHQRVVRGRTEMPAHIERLRRQLRSDKRLIDVNDMGIRKYRRRRIADIAHTSLTPAKYSLLFSRIIQHVQAKNILELGTSLGINTLYLAHARPRDTTVTTFEGADAIADLAALTFEMAEAKNIVLIRGNIDQTLPRYLQSGRIVDFVYLDANHRYEPSLRYFTLLLPRLTEKSVVVFDDIHYSRDMYRAWNDIKSHKLVYGSIDLFRCGILFFDPSLNKQHVTLQV